MGLSQGYRISPSPPLSHDDCAGPLALKEWRAVSARGSARLKTSTAASTACVSTHCRAQAHVRSHRLTHARVSQHVA